MTGVGDEDIAALRDRARRFQLALDGASQGVWDHNMVTGDIFLSDVWKRIRGYEPHEDVDALAGPWLDRLHPDDRPRILDAITRQNLGELNINSFEYREKHRDGRWIWILSRGRPVDWLPDGRVARILGTDTDITVLKMAELALAEEKERLLVTLRSIGEGLISVDAAGVITNFNDAAATVTGWPVAEVVGRRVSDVLDIRSSADLPITETLIMEALSLRAGVTLADDTLLVRRDGSHSRAYCSISPVVIDSAPIGLVIVFRDTTHEHAVKERLQHTATHDPLTELPNRRAFEMAMDNAILTAHRESRRHMLCLIDLDGFKKINDGAGHAAGDHVLRAVAACLSRCCRSNDFVARLGGDEFAVLLTDTADLSAHKICDRITKAVAALSFDFDGRPYGIGASIGTKSIAGEGHSASELMSAADKACYEAKFTGKGKWVSADRQAA